MADVETRYSSHGRYHFQFLGMNTRTRELRLLRENSVFSQMIEKEVKEFRPNLIVEMSAVLDVDVETSDSEMADLLLKLFNTCADIELLDNLTYLDKELKTERPLFTSSFLISSPQDHSVIPFKPYKERVPGTLYILQELPPFGTIIGEQEMIHRNNGFLFRNTLLSPMKYKKVPVVEAENSITYVGISQHEGSLYLYCLFAVKGESVVRLFRRRFENNIFSRMDSLFSWIREKAIEVLEQ